jgi:hypothetical protein
MSALAITDWDRAGNAPACDSCIDYRAELERVNAKLAKANEVLRLIRRLEAKPEKPEGVLDDPAECIAIGYAMWRAKIHARIDLYLAATRQKP